MAMTSHSLLCGAWARWSEGSVLLAGWRANGNQIQSFAGSASLRVMPRMAPYAMLLLGFCGLGVAFAYPPLTLAILLLLLLAAGAYFRPGHGALVLPFALMLGFRIPLGLAGDELLFIRPEHAILAGASLGLMRVRPARIDHALLTVWAGLFIVLCTATLAAQVRGVPGNPLFALITLAQFATWAFVFACARASALRFGEPGIRAWLLPVAGLAACGILEWLWPFERVAGYRTFERVFFQGQANHMGGLFAMAVILCVALAANLRWRAGALLAGGLCALALFTTRSKEALLAAAAGLSAMAWLRFPRLRLPGALLATLACAWLLLWPPSLFTQTGSSLADRFEAWRNVSAGVLEHPLFGIGLGARHRSYYDSQYVMLLAEAGVIGLGAFMYWLVAHIRALARASGADKGNVVALGAFGAWVALTCQSLASIGFLVTVMGGPAAWLCGYAIGLGERERG